MDTVIQPRRTSAAAYLFAILAVATASGVIVLIHPLVERGAFLIFLAGVALTTWFAGWRPGILAIALSLLAGIWFVLPPVHTLIVQTWDDWMRLTVYMLVAGMITALHASRERAVDRAWQTEQRLAFALHCAAMGAWQSDLKTGKFWWSQGMEELFGRPPGQFSGSYEGFIGYIHPDDQDFVKRAVTRTIEGGKEFEIEHRIVRPDGQIRWIFTRGRIVCDDNDTPQQVIGVAVDITHGRKEKAVADIPTRGSGEAA